MGKCEVGYCDPAATQGLKHLQELNHCRPCRQELEAVIVRYLAATGTLSQAGIHLTQLPPALVPSTSTTEIEISTADISDDGAADEPSHVNQEPESSSTEKGIDGGNKGGSAVNANAESADAPQIGSRQSGTSAADAGDHMAGGVANDNTTAGDRGENQHEAIALDSRMPDGSESGEGNYVNETNKEIYSQIDDYRLPSAAIHLGLLAGA